MKILRALSFSLLSVFIITSLHAKEALNILDAAEQGLVGIKILGVDEDYSEDYNWNELTPSVQISLVNRSNEPIDIRLDAGQTFTSMDNSVQNMMVSNTELMTLNPKEGATMEAYALCIEEMKMGPTDVTRLRLGPKADGPLLAMAEFIDENDYHTYSAAQDAVWVITDGAAIYDIMSDIPRVEDALKAKAKELTTWEAISHNVEVEVIETVAAEIWEPEFESVFDNAEYVIAGVSYNLSQQSNILVALFEGDKMERVYVDYETKPAGVYNQEFSVPQHALLEGEHEMRVFVDGKLVHSQVVEAELN